MSAETLNFGPQWLRDLSGGTSSTVTTSSSTGFSSLSKFELAENRYGREEMLALFVDEDTDVPDELLRAPSLMLEIAQLPLALRPDTSHIQSPSVARGRGGVTTSLGGRSISVRGRGRGRVGGPWDEHDDMTNRKPPLLRRAESEDWRSDSLRGKGDGAEDILNGMKEWRFSAQRKDPLKDTWRDRPSDIKDQKPFRNRSVSARDADDSSRSMWLEENSESSTAFKPSFERSKFSDENWRRDDSDSLADVPEKPQELSSKEQETISDESGKNAEEVAHATEQKTINTEENMSVQSSTEMGTVVSQSQEEVTEIFNPSVEKVNMETTLQKSTIFQDTAAVPEDSIRAHAVSESKHAEPPVLAMNDASIPDTTQFMSKLPTPIAQLQALATTWFYKDPQGDTQGPFDSSQMMEWFNAGYFTMVLQVKRACDSQFVPLGELIKQWGQVPFRPPVKAKEKDEEEITRQNLMQFHQEQLKYQHFLHQQDFLKSNEQAGVESALAKLVKSNEFRSMSPQHQHIYFSKYMDELEHINPSQQVNPNISQFESIRHAEDLHSTQPRQLPTNNFEHEVLSEQNRMLEEERRREEEEIRRIKKEQEEQKELLRIQEEEIRRKKEMLLREQEEMKQLQLEALKKKQQLEEQEALQRKIEEEERIKRQQEEFERRREEEQERMREIAKQEALQRKLQQEEQLRRAEEEMRRRKLQQEEEKRKLEKQRQEEERKLELQKQAARKQKQRLEQEEKARRVEKQMRAMQLPSSALWGQVQQQATNNSPSLLEIQQIQKHHEQILHKEKELQLESEMQRQHRNKSGWASAGTHSHTGNSFSLAEIQRQEAEQMASAKQPTRVEATPSFNFNTSWNKPPKIQPDVPKKNPKAQASFWDQVVEESAVQKPQQVKQPLPKPNNAGHKKTKADEGKQVKALFQQQVTKDAFMEWCEGYLQRMNAGHSIDIPTFVNFLRDVESPFEVEEYVQSYLGETKDAKDFAKLFLEKRKSTNGSAYDLSSKATSKTQQSDCYDADGFVFVTGNTKRGKKKSKKSQKVDPSILGFSVNAASDRVNMGEIQSADD